MRILDNNKTGGFWMNKVLDFDEAMEPEFVRDSEGAQRARLGVNTFRRLSEEFGAVYKIGKVRLTNWETFKNGLERYRES